MTVSHLLWGSVSTGIGWGRRCGHLSVLLIFGELGRPGDVPHFWKPDTKPDRSPPQTQLLFSLVLA